MFDLFLGQGIFTTDGDQWRQHRQLLKPFFSRERITVSAVFARNFCLKQPRTTAASSCTRERCCPCSACTPTTATRSTSRSVPTTAIAIIAELGQDLFGRFSMDVGTDFLFGRCVKSLDALICKDEAWGRFCGAFNEAAFVGATRVRMCVASSPARPSV